MKEKNHKFVQKIWDEDVPLSEQIELLQHMSIKYIDICGNENDNCFSGYFSFIRCYDEKGDYKFTLPYLVEAERDENDHPRSWIEVEHPFIVAEWSRVNMFYTYEPVDLSNSNNGGDYFAGWVLFSHPRIGLKAEHNECLHSDFESQGWSGGTIHAKSMREMSEKLATQKEHPLQ